jgi:hypothetical protein
VTAVSDVKELLERFTDFLLKLDKYLREQSTISFYTLYISFSARPKVFPNVRGTWGFKNPFINFCALKVGSLLSPAIIC